MAQAELYTVRTSRGVIYAVVAPGDGGVWTERTEAAARRLAEERGLEVIAQRDEITHADFLRMLGHMPDAEENAATQSQSPASDGAPSPAGPASSIAGAPVVEYFPVGPAPIKQPYAPIQARYHWEDDPPPVDDLIVVPKAQAPAVANVFCSNEEVRPDAAARSGDADADGR